ncbi:hypothetical protein [Paenibacillus sp. GM2]|uniref:hypothetical protein n=1 Tax=Paenibacillus sp. GM2 TaxID=1622070 RepID=UPI000837F1D9|nr:hypothetical protein [Paenibacillus sp. GM2]
MEKINFDEEQLKKRILDRIQFKLNNNNHLNKPISNDQSEVVLKPLIDSHNILDVEFFSHRKILGKYIVRFKKILRKLLRPLFMKQIHFNQKVIDQFYIVDRQQVEQNNINNEVFHSISIGIVDDIVDECKIALQEVVSSNLESIRSYYENELQAKINEQMNEHINEHLTQTKEQMNRTMAQLYRDIKSSIFRDLAMFEGNGNDELSRYHMLLMALRENPENIDIEMEAIAAFERMNKSRLKTNDSI